MSKKEDVAETVYTNLLLNLEKAHFLAMFYFILGDFYCNKKFNCNKNFEKEIIAIYFCVFKKKKIKLTFTS